MGQYALSGFAFLFATAVIAGIATEHHIDNVQKAQQASLIAGCHRQNVRTALDNRSQQADYTFFSAVLSETQQAFAKVPAEAKAGGAKFLPLLEASVDKKAWVPLTPCRAQIAQKGSRYEAPSAVLFITRPPPESALKLGPND